MCILTVLLGQVKYFGCAVYSFSLDQTVDIYGIQLICIVYEPVGCISLGACSERLVHVCKL